MSTNISYNGLHNIFNDVPHAILHPPINMHMRNKIRITHTLCNTTVNT